MKKIDKSFPTKCFVLFALGTIASGCNGNPASSTTVTANLPVIASANNAFTFVVSANNYSHNGTWGLMFNSDSISFAITSTNFASGSVLFSVTDSNNSTIFQETLVTNDVIAITQSGKGIPANCTINCSRYTGTMTIAVGGYGTTQ